MREWLIALLDFWIDKLADVADRLERTEKPKPKRKNDGVSLRVYPGSAWYMVDDERPWRAVNVSQQIVVNRRMYEDYARSRQDILERYHDMPRMSAENYATALSEVEKER